MNRREKWVEETIQMAEVVATVEAPTSLASLDVKKFVSLSASSSQLNSTAKWAIAASILLLVGINSFTMLRYSNIKPSGSTASNIVYTEYFSYINQ